jgi:delta-aminolevulinic acid dehydratase/porphobilinogen synthase
VEERSSETVSEASNVPMNVLIVYLSYLGEEQQDIFYKNARERGLVCAMAEAPPPDWSSSGIITGYSLSTDTQHGRIGMYAYDWHSSVSNAAYVAIVEAGKAFLQEETSDVGYPSDLIDQERPDLAEHVKRVKQEMMKTMTGPKK